MSVALSLRVALCQIQPVAAPHDYRWLADTCRITIENSIPAPTGYKRISAMEDSFAEWLRKLPLHDGHPPVHLFNGELKDNQAAHFAVVRMDVGDRDLQQCADAIIRLRAEYLLAGNNDDQIGFHFTSGDRAAWSEWQDGLRPTVRGNRVTWTRTASPDSSYSCFRQYLNTVFMYAGTASLNRELPSVAVASPVEIGDVFIQGGSPGHAVMVVDVAADSAGQRAFLLAQSYMPAQEVHILRSPLPDLNPWYIERPSGNLDTPEWTFSFSNRKRFQK